MFENEVRFENCIFEEDVLFGDENTDQAFCTIKSDLVFDGCTFRKKVKLDGLQCSGHVVVKRCVFEYGGGIDNTEYVLSMANAKIGIGVSIEDSNFIAGINFSAMHVNQIGCQIFNSRVENPKCTISFLSSYMARELSINWSSIVCKNIDFERTSVDSNGSIQFKGKFYYGKALFEVLCSLLNFKNEELEYKWLASIYRKYELQREENYIKICVDEEHSHVTQMLKDILKNNHMSFEETSCYPYDSNSVVNAIVGDLICLNHLNGSIYYALFIGGTICIARCKGDVIDYVRYDIEDYAPIIFKDLANFENVSIDRYYLSSHVGVPMVYATLSKEDKYIAIYDENIGWKIFKWNYIECEAVANVFLANVGTGLYVTQTIFNSYTFDIHGLHAENDIVLQDIIFNVKSLQANEIDAQNLMIDDVQFVCNNTKGGDMYINDSNADKWQLNVSNTQIANNMAIKSIVAINDVDGTYFTIQANHLIVEGCMNLFNISDNNDNKRLLINLQDSKINQVLCSSYDYKTWVVETENLQFDEFYLNGERPNYKILKQMWTQRTFIGNSDNSEKISPIHFFKQIDKLYEKHDNYDDQRKLWKLRNRMRILRDHKYSAWLRIPINVLVLNYGWSPWRIIIWLVLIIAYFDFKSWNCYGMDIETSIVNGFVEFLPVSFNKPIIDQLRTGVESNLDNIGYSELVTGYRMVSYFLLSILVAAFSGYFRKKNQ